VVFAHGWKSSTDTVLIGWVARAHGVRGAVRAKATGPTLGELAPGEWVVLRAPEGDERSARLESVAGDEGRPVLTFAGLEGREAAAALAGREIRVPAERVPALEDPDTFYVRDLVGCVVAAGGRELGQVVDVIPRPANDALEVEGPSGSLLVPLTDDAVEEIDLPGRRVHVRADIVLGTDR